MFDKLKTWQVALAILIMLCTISGTGWKFYDCKASKVEVAEVKDDFSSQGYGIVKKFLAEGSPFSDEIKTEMDVVEDRND